MKSPDVKVRPQIYIDVVINGQKQIYEVEAAKALHEELGVALSALFDKDTPIPEDTDSNRQTVFESQ